MFITINGENRKNTYYCVVGQQIQIWSSKDIIDTSCVVAIEKVDTWGRKNIKNARKCRNLLKNVKIICRYQK